ncbi:hypothetical protein AVEN_193742-1 [Araneus ventricosus]|uniref:TIL domain-containing protein n=1 Tax=Araneus ventricosus TaxID=182803 RepID=A0A4Y2DMQ3_ARAVE|nr:hypothetical protein AVEN_193742-1 [Araneus ventricosus]
MKVHILFLSLAVVMVVANETEDCPENKTYGSFGDCPESCYSLTHPRQACTMKINYGCRCEESYVLLRNMEFTSDCIKSEDCPNES